MTQMNQPPLITTAFVQNAAVSIISLAQTAHGIITLAQIDEIKKCILNYEKWWSNELFKIADSSGYRRGKCCNRACLNCIEKTNRKTSASYIRRSECNILSMPYVRFLRIWWLLWALRSTVNIKRKQPHGKEDEKMITIQCSNCGKIRNVRNSMQSALKCVEEGWGSFGSAFYCPDCVKTWDERNEKPLSDANTTFCRIMNVLIKNVENKTDNT